MKTALLLLATFYVANGLDATLRILTNVTGQGAVCLDGSPPGYYIRPGSGEGEDKWIVHLEGGGICFFPQLCYQRSLTSLGSSLNWAGSKRLYGFISDDPAVNPDFYNWNVVQVQYCDGGVYSSDVIEPYEINNSTIYLRGRRILMASIEAILLEGMSNATDIILSGSSAGALATYIQVDQIAAMLPTRANFRALADGGFFVDAPTTAGQPLFLQASIQVGVFQNLSASASPACAARYNGTEVYKCGFVSTLFPFIKTPLFILNSQRDTWQLQNVVQLGCNPLSDCTAEQLKFVESFRETWLAQAGPAISSASGAFIDSCYEHTQANLDEPWSNITVDGQLMRDVFANWYYNRVGRSKVEDCTEPDCNGSCPVGPTDGTDLPTENSPPGNSGRSTAASLLLCLTLSVLGALIHTLA